LQQQSSSNSSIKRLQDTAAGLHGSPIDASTAVAAAATTAAAAAITAATNDARADATPDHHQCGGPAGGQFG